MLPEGIAIDIEVDLGTVPSAFALAARLNVTIPGLDHDTAEALVQQAHEVCPYSRATRGNIAVSLNVLVFHAAQA